MRQTQSMAGQQGFALTTSLIILAIVGALIAGAVFTTMFETNVALNDAAAAQAQYVAQAGLQKYKAVLFQAFRYNEAIRDDATYKCQTSLSFGIDLNRDGIFQEGEAWDNNRLVLNPEPVLDVNGNVIGTYTVTLLMDPNNDSRITVVSEGETAPGQNWRQAKARAVSTFIIRNSAGTEQAIFAGTGHGMKFFNGNTEVYGGVHIVGDKNNANTPVIDTRGNSRILNGYTKNDAGDTSSFLINELEAADNLCASVRVQYGRVIVDGDSQFGSRDNPLLTVAVGDEPDDLEAKNTGCDSQKLNVCAHSIGLFDLWESAPVFPLLDEPPGTELCPTPKTWRTCIHEEADQDGMRLTLTGPGASTVQLTGALAALGVTLPSGCQTALNAAAASSTNTLVLSNNTVDCRVEVEVAGPKYGFYYNNGIFEVYGNLNIRGLNLEFTRNTTFVAQSRSSTGSVQDYAALSLEKYGSEGGTFIAKADFVASPAKKFPDNVLTLVAEGDVKLLGGSNAYTLPVYAGDAFMSASGSRLFGQAIADTFCTVQPSGQSKLECKDKGGSPAKIFYVPTGHNRPDSFNAVSPQGGIPTFRVEAYELR